jgi:hypothetical protein
VIDLTREVPIPLAAACRLVPPARRGKKTHLSTLLRWINRGARAPTGQLVRLEAVRLGNRWHTTRAALQRFAESLTPQPPADPLASVPRTTGQRQRATERAAAQLDQLGL